MVKKICTICNKEFEAKSIYTKKTCCSKKCSVERKRIYFAEYQKKNRKKLNKNTIRYYMRKRGEYAPKIIRKVDINKLKEQKLEAGRRFRERFKNEINKNIKEKYQIDEAFRKLRLEQSKKYARSEQGQLTRKKYRSYQTASGKHKFYHKTKLDRIKNNPDKLTAFKLERALRARLWYALKASSSKKRLSAKSLVGCSTSFLRAYLEKKFYSHPITGEQMTWKNYGRKNKINCWVVDHIKPVDFYIKKYDFNDSRVQKICFHYTNLQPLWDTDNLKKSNKILND